MAVPTREGSKKNVNGPEIIKEALSAKGWTMAALARELGYSAPNGVRNRLVESKNLHLDTFVSFLDVLGFDVVVTSRTGSKERWQVTRSDGDSVPSRGMRSEGD